MSIKNPSHQLTHQTIDAQLHLHHMDLNHHDIPLNPGLAPHPSLNRHSLGLSLRFWNRNAKPPASPLTALTVCAAAR
jgi:hypothetical protein